MFGADEDISVYPLCMDDTEQTRTGLRRTGRTKRELTKTDNRSGSYMSIGGLMPVWSGRRSYLEGCDVPIRSLFNKCAMNRMIFGARTACAVL